MANMLEQGADFLSAKRHETQSSSVTYQRGSSAPITIKATIGRSDFQSQGSDGFIIDEQTTDFIFRLADLVVDDNAFLPLRGDQITLVQAGKTYTFMVIHNGEEAPYRYSDDFKNDIRVHAKLSGVS